MHALQSGKPRRISPAPPCTSPPPAPLGEGARSRPASSVSSCRSLGPLVLPAVRGPLGAAGPADAGAINNSPARTLLHPTRSSSHAHHDPNGQTNHTSQTTYQSTQSTRSSPLCRLHGYCGSPSAVPVYSSVDSADSSLSSCDSSIPLSSSPPSPTSSTSSLLLLLDENASEAVRQRQLISLRRPTHLRRSTSRSVRRPDSLARPRRPRPSRPVRPLNLHLFPPHIPTHLPLIRRLSPLFPLDDLFTDVESQSQADSIKAHSIKRHSLESESVDYLPPTSIHPVHQCHITSVVSSDPLQLAMPQVGTLDSSRYSFLTINSLAASTTTVKPRSRSAARVSKLDSARHSTLRSALNKDLPPLPADAPAANLDTEDLESRLSDARISPKSLSPKSLSSKSRRPSSSSVSSRRPSASSLRLSASASRRPSTVSPRSSLPASPKSLNQTASSPPRARPASILIPDRMSNVGLASPIDLPSPNYTLAQQRRKSSKGSSRSLRLSGRSSSRSSSSGSVGSILKTELPPLPTPAQSEVSLLAQPEIIPTHHLQPLDESSDESPDGDLTTFYDAFPSDELCELAPLLSHPSSPATLKSMQELSLRSNSPLRKNRHASSQSDDTARTSVSSDLFLADVKAKESTIMNVHLDSTIVDPVAEAASETREASVEPPALDTSSLSASVESESDGPDATITLHEMPPPGPMSSVVSVSDSASLGSAYVRRLRANASIHDSRRSRDLRSFAPPVNALLPAEASEEAQSRLRKKYNLIRELIETEQIFATDMAVVVDIYQAKLRSEKYFGYVCKTDTRNIFSNIDQVLLLSRQFVTALRDATASYVFDSKDQSKDIPLLDVETHVAAAVLEFIPRIEATFQTYCDNNKDQMATFYRLRTMACPNVDAWLNECLTESKGMTTAWTLDALLIKPVQRLLKYPLLLDGLMKTTSDDHPDYAAIKLAGENIRLCVDVINSDRSLAGSSSSSVNNPLLTSSSKSSSLAPSISFVSIPSTPTSTTHDPDGGDLRKLSTNPSADRALQDLLAEFRRRRRSIRALIQSIATNAADIQQQFNSNESLAKAWLTWSMSLGADEDESPRVRRYKHYALFSTPFKSTSSTQLSTAKLSRKIERDVLLPLEKVSAMYERTEALASDRVKFHAAYAKYVVSKTDLSYASRGSSNSGQAAGNMSSSELSKADLFFKYHSSLKDGLPDLFALSDQMVECTVAKLVEIQRNWFRMVVESMSSVFNLKPETEIDDKDDPLVKEYHERASQSRENMLQLGICRGIFSDMSDESTPPSLKTVPSRQSTVDMASLCSTEDSASLAPVASTATMTLRDRKLQLKSSLISLSSWQRNLKQTPSRFLSSVGN